MLTGETSKLFLTFKDRELEADFKRKNDWDVRLFNRFGIYLSILGWSIGMVAAYFIFGNTILLPICIVATILLPLFTVIVVITQFKKYSNLYQPLTALANFLAAFLMIY